MESPKKSYFVIGFAPLPGLRVDRLPCGKHLFVRITARQLGIGNDKETAERFAFAERPAVFFFPIGLCDFPCRLPRFLFAGQDGLDGPHVLRRTDDDGLAGLDGALLQRRRIRDIHGAADDPEVFI